MDLIVDANILFAGLIKKNLTSKLLFKNSLHLFAPEFILIEFRKYKNHIQKKTERNDAEFDRLLDVLGRRITLIPLEEIKPFINKAKEISPDPKDVPYVALSLKMKIAIWSNDKALKEKQDTVKIYNTDEVRKF